jgi:hypothetical protein
LNSTQDSLNDASGLITDDGDGDGDGDGGMVLSLPLMRILPSNRPWTLSCIGVRFGPRRC